MDVMKERGIQRRISFQATDSLIARFWRRVRVGSTDECWPWIGAHRNGYGAIKHGHKVLSAHVVSYVIHHGQIPDGMLVTHSCDNRTCCNPSHLHLGTFRDNVIEMQQRRLVSTQRGIEAYNAILDEDRVREIRRFASENHCGYVRASRHFGLNKHTVRNVLRGETWKHVV